jgi:hypothetical protein
MPHELIAKLPEVGHRPVGEPCAFRAHNGLSRNVGRHVDVLAGSLPPHTRLFTAICKDLRFPRITPFLGADFALSLRSPGAALEPASGDCVLALADTGGITFKRLIRDGGRILLRPLNPVYTVQQVADLKTYGVLRRLVVTRDFRR